MNIKVADNLYIIKIDKKHVNNLYDTDEILEILKNNLIYVKKFFHISGLCSIDIYVNYLYGIIIEIDNINKYGNDLDIKVKFHINSYFLSEIEFDDIDKYNLLYYYNNKFYTNYTENLDSIIVYKNVQEIINKGIKLK